MHSNPAHGEVYIFVSDLWQVGGFLLVTAVSSTNKTKCHNIAEIYLKVLWILLTVCHIIVGMPVCHGVVTGVCRVIKSLPEADSIQVNLKYNFV